ncbi:hypothetical protein NIES4101_82690 [Calothrix sp. NIES-4101]|nr:hypothetical protein NIES4101_82690 [Calothrix sp. NIES-4101]
MNYLLNPVTFASKDRVYTWLTSLLRIGDVRRIFDKMMIVPVKKVKLEVVHFAILSQLREFLENTIYFQITFVN